MSVPAEGPIVSPAELREQDHIEPGEERRPNDGVVEWLLACPEKGFFVPIGGESTDGS